MYRELANWREEIHSNSVEMLRIGLVSMGERAKGGGRGGNDSVASTGEKFEHRGKWT